jgi:hypothetical protein
MAEKPMARLLDAVTGNKVAEGLPSYVERRDENIRRHKKQIEDNPAAAIGGTVAGAIVQGIPMAALAPIRAASLLGRAAQTGAVGGAQGLLANPGDQEGVIADGLQLDERYANAGKGALTGAVASGAIDAAGKTLGAVVRSPQALKKMAETKAFKASGAMLRDYRKTGGEDGVRRVGRFMLDNGMVKAGGTFDDVAAAATKAEGSSGKQLGDLVEQLGLDEALSGTKSIDRNAIAAKLEEKLLSNQDLPGVNERNAMFKQLIDEFRAGNSGSAMGVAEAEGLKRGTGGLVNWKRLPDADIPDREQFYRALYGELKESAEDRATKLGDEAFKGLKNDYGTAKEVKKIASDRVLREQANRMFSPTDYGAGLFGAAAGFASGDGIKGRLKNAAIGASLGVANKAARSYGNPLLAKGADKVADFLIDHPNLTGQFAKRAVDAVERGSGGLLIKGGAAARAAAQAATAGDPEFQSAVALSPDDVIKSPQLMKMFKDKPELIDGIRDEKIRAQVQKALGREPAGAPKKIKHGTIKDGRIFYGGDPDDQKNWKLLRKGQGGK